MWRLKVNQSNNVQLAIIKKKLNLFWPTKSESNDVGSMQSISNISINQLQKSIYIWFKRSSIIRHKHLQVQLVCCDKSQSSYIPTGCAISRSHLHSSCVAGQNSARALGIMWVSVLREAAFRGTWGPLMQCIANAQAVHNFSSTTVGMPNDKHC